MSKTKTKLYKTEDWHEELNSCIFFHFENFNEPPETLCSSPTSSDFEALGDKYWTHFIQIDFNNLFDQAETKPLKHQALDALREAEAKMYAYACELDLGEERTRAFEVYENIRNAPRR